MTYNEIIEIVKKGKTGMLPNFKGYFKWDFSKDKMLFYNEDYVCLAERLNIQKRNDFYYII